MEAKDKLESLRFLAELHRNQVDERRKYEWKVVFTVLSFFVLTVAACLKEKIKLPSPWCIVLFLGLAFVASGFLIFVHVANHTNKKIAEKAEEAIVDILNGINRDINIFPENRPRCYAFCDWFSHGAKWAWFWQTIVLLLFAVLAILIITS